MPSHAVIAYVARLLDLPLQEADPDDVDPGNLELDMPRDISAYLKTPDMAKVFKDLGYEGKGQTGSATWADGQTLNTCYQKVYGPGTSICAWLCQGVIGFQYFVPATQTWAGFWIEPNEPGQGFSFWVKNGYHAASVLKALDAQVTRQVKDPDFDSTKLRQLLISVCLIAR